MKKYFSLVLAIFVFSIFAMNVTINPANAQESDSTTAPQEYVGEVAAEIFIEGATALLIKDVNPWCCAGNQGALEELGISYNLINSSSLSGVDLSQYKFVIYASDQYSSTYNRIADNLDKISAYVKNGGQLIAHACDGGWNGGYWSNSILPGEVAHGQASPASIHIEVPNHCVVTGLDDAYFFGWSASSHGYFTNLVPDTQIIMTCSNGPTYIEYSYGQGRVMATMQTIEWGYCGCYVLRKEFLLNELACARDWQPGGGGDCDLTPVLEALEVIESKLDALPTDDLMRTLKGLTLAVDSLEAKSDALEAKLDDFLASGEVIEMNDLAPGQGGVFFIGATKQPKPEKPLKEQQGQE